MPDLTDRQRAFLETYFGVSTAAQGAFADRWKSAYGTWRDAMEQVDSQIAQLQSVLKSSDDPELKEIGEYGLNAVTGNHKVRMMAALMEVDRAGDRPESAMVAAASKRIAGFDAHLASDPRVAAVDKNPFGVRISVVSTLRPALNGLTRALKAAPAG